MNDFEWTAVTTMGDLLDQRADAYGDRSQSCCPIRWKSLAVMFGAMKIGAVPVPINAPFQGGRTRSGHHPLRDERPDHLRGLLDRAERGAGRRDRIAPPRAARCRARAPVPRRGGHRLDERLARPATARPGARHRDHHLHVRHDSRAQGRHAELRPWRASSPTTTCDSAEFGCSPESHWNRTGWFR
jgi:hypothetical protein